MYLSTNGVVNGNLNIKGNLGVTGASIFYNNLTVNGDLITMGANTQNGDFNVLGNLGVSGTIGVTGAATFYNNANIAGNLGVTGNSNIYGNEVVSGTLGVTGATELRGAVVMKTSSTLYGNSIVNGNETINGKLVAKINGDAHQLTITDILNNDSTVVGSIRTFNSAQGISFQAGAGTSFMNFADYTNINIGARIDFPSKAAKFYGNVRQPTLGLTNAPDTDGTSRYTFDIPTSGDEDVDLAGQLRLSNNVSGKTIMNAKLLGNQVHFMNGSATPLLLVGNTGPGPGATGARVYDDTFYKPPSVETPYFPYLYAGAGTPSIPNGSITATGTGTFGNVSSLGSLSFGVPSIVDTTYFIYSPTAVTTAYTPDASTWPNGTYAGNFAGSGGTTYPLTGGTTWTCPTSGLWYVEAYMVSSNTTSGIGIANTNPIQQFPIAKTILSGSNYQSRVNILTTIYVNNNIVITADTGSVGTFFANDGGGNATFMSFKLIAAFN